jgi:hypothetical protein
MPMPDDVSSYQAAQGTQPAPPAIWAPNATWDLGASPDELDAIAGVLRGVGSAGDLAQDTMDRAAFRVAADGAWEGDTAEAYHQHRAKLSRDLVDFAERAPPAARALAEVAGVLRHGQQVLDRERNRLSQVPGMTISGIPGLFDGAVIFLPRDEGEASTVREALAAAEDVRARVDEGLAGRIAEFRTAGAAYEMLEQAWQPRTVTHLNLNAGMGRGAGTVRENLDELAEAIASGEADVVTLQEVLHHNLDDDGETPGLLSLLEERTGDRWRVAALSDPIQTDPRGWDPDNPGTQPYGNAVLVREGGAVEVPADSDVGDLELSQPQDAAGYEDAPEDRSAAVAEVTIRE